MGFPVISYKQPIKSHKVTLGGAGAFENVTVFSEIIGRNTLFPFKN